MTTNRPFLSTALCALVLSNAAAADVYGDLAATAVRALPAAPGAYVVEVEVDLAPGPVAPAGPVLVRVFRGADAIWEDTFEGFGIPSGSCCSFRSDCAATDGFTVQCTGTCPSTQGGGPRECLYHWKGKSLALPLAPGDSITAVVDPDGWHDETGAPGTSNNAASAIVPEAPESYCAGKVNSAGCVPVSTWSGAPSASSPDAFLVGAEQVLAGKLGILFYGHDQATTPFQGGTLCVRAPVRRTPVQVAAGDPAAGGCLGSYSLDFNARIRSGVDPSLTAGAWVAAQHWYRDVGDPAGFHTGLSDALWFRIGD